MQISRPASPGSRSACPALDSAGEYAHMMEGLRKAGWEIVEGGGYLISTSSSASLLGPSIMTARVSPSRYGCSKERDALAAQLRHPRVEIGHAQRDVVLQLPARTGQRGFALVRVPGQHHVAELDPGARRAEHPLAVERRPGAIGAARHLAVRLGRRRAGEARAHRRVQVLLIPEQRAQRLLLPQMHVVEPLGRIVAGVLDQRVVRAPPCRRTRRRPAAARPWRAPRRSAPASGRARRRRSARCRC